MTGSQRLPLGVWTLLGSRWLNTIAVATQVTMLGVLVFEITGRELDLGLLGIAEFLPTLLLSPFTGAVTDRFDRRIVMAIGLGGEVLAALGLFVFVRSEPTTLAPILGLAFLFGIARAVYAPPARALPVDLAPVGMVERVLALNAATWQTGGIIGPVVGGFLYAADPSWPFLFCSGLLGLSLLSTALVPEAPVGKLATAGARAAISDAIEGLKFVRQTPVLFGAISLDLFAVLFGGAVALLPAIAEERLGVGPIGVGWLRAAIGVGAAVTSLSLAVRPVTRNVGKVLLFVVGVFGLATLVLGFTQSYVVAFLALLTLAAADSVSVNIRSTIVPLATPEHMRGRVLATENVFIGASNELGAAESGVAAHFLGLVGAVVTGGLGTIAVVGIWWKAFPALRSIDRFEDLRPEQGA